jgi:hypothetical protein
VPIKFEESGEYSADESALSKFEVVDYTTNRNTLVVENEDYKLVSIYVGESSWEYTLEGILPNPCYTADTQVLIAESFPEQVTVNLNIGKPSVDKVCIQQIQDLKLTGEYSASEQATLNLKIVRE